MGKSKGGKRSVSGGPHKSHGPKRKLFHQYSSTIRLAFGKAGVLDKYHSIESFMYACQAKGLKYGTPADWENRFKFFTQDLKTREEQKEWLRNCKNYKDPEPVKKKIETVKA